jgi:hypothetical protein
MAVEISGSGQMLQLQLNLRGGTKNDAEIPLNVVCVVSLSQYGARGSVMVKALCYKLEGRGFDAR